jgi:hypothetical protein
MKIEKRIERSRKRYLLHKLREEGIELKLEFKSYDAYQWLCDIMIHGNHICMSMYCNVHTQLGKYWTLLTLRSDDC